VEVVIRSTDPLVAAIAGTLDHRFPPREHEQILAAALPGRQATLDMSGVTDISPGGLRRLLQLYRRLTALGARPSIVGAAPEIRDMAEAAGFLHLPHSLPAGQEPITLPAGGLAGQRIDFYPTHWHGGFGLRVGVPLLLGGYPVPAGINFAVFSSAATSCTLVLFERGAARPFVEIPFPEEFRVGNVFAMLVFGLDHEQVSYGFRMDGPHAPRQGHRFDPSHILLDPLARATAGRAVWGEPADPAEVYPRRACLLPQDFDWDDDRPPNVPMEETVIYEMHVRGFTRHPSSGVRFPGTYAGLRDEVPYLKELGVNAVELMPICEFEELEESLSRRAGGERLVNYWGYNTIAFVAPKASYAAGGKHSLQVDELKALVKELHRAGIEVFLDVVFNHTAEGDESGPTIHFRGIDNRTYYMLTPEGKYVNFSGTGNTLNCNHPVVREMIVHCLRYWAATYRIDGFRFDLASILGRDEAGRPLSNPPLLEALAHDPILANCKLIAEAWDAGGLYQVGSFPAYGRWAEWNGKYRDCVRKFLKGDAGQVSELAQRIAGSPDLYRERGPSASVNFVTCHDGFTLWDLVSYDDKHNEANGEANRDGANDNYSWNCGVEGPTDDPQMLALRRRQVKNALTILFVSQGTPMLLMGDEVGRTQEGNNNAYCHDSPLTWMDWTLKDKNAELFRFCRLMIAFRKRHPCLRHELHGGAGGSSLQLIWHGVQPERPDWSAESRSLAFSAGHRNGGEEDWVYVALNAYWETLRFELPAAPAGLRWHVFANTGMAPPADVCEPGAEAVLGEQEAVLVGARSAIVLVAR
jgi:glycogen operon protein